MINKVGPLSPPGLRAGVVLYNNEAKIEIFLNDFFDRESFNAAIERLNYEPGTMTRIDLGLKESIKLFEEENGARGTSKKVRHFFCSRCLNVDKDCVPYIVKNLFAFWIEFKGRNACDLLYNLSCFNH